RLERLEPDGLAVARGRVEVEDVRDAAAHAGREVASGGTEHDYATAGHVLAAVVADALDDSGRAGVADGEPLAREAADERPARRRPVQHGVADDDVLLGPEGGILRGADRDDPARETLADIVVRVADERQLEPGCEPRSE